MESAKTKRSKPEGVQVQNQERTGNRISMQKYLEVAFWGTIFWGIIRVAIHFLNFTPYGLASFGRSFQGMIVEKTFAGAALGMLVLFVCSLLASFIYMLLFSRTRIWWSGLLFGALVLLAVGFFLHIDKWEISTLSTEAAWFLSYGLFIGMTLSLESSDQ